MSRLLKRKLALAVAIIAIVSGASIAAVSATGQGTPTKPGHARHAGRRGAGRLLALAAGYLGLSPTQLSSELRSGKTLAQIANATSGKSEAGLIQAIVFARKAKLAKSAANLPNRVSAEVNRPLRRMAATRTKTRGGAHAAARDYLGLPAAQLRSELLAGKTLAQIADTTAGKSEAGLIEAIVAVKSGRLSAAVSAGRLTKASESARLTRLTARVKAIVNRKHAKKSR
jgi:energy-converting hydrogenase Eha subunit B